MDKKTDVESIRERQVEFYRAKDGKKASELYERISESATISIDILLQEIDRLAAQLAAVQAKMDAAVADLTELANKELEKCCDGIACGYCSENMNEDTDQCNDGKWGCFTWKGVSDVPAPDAESEGKAE